MNHSYQLVARKRTVVPNWLYWLFCRRLPMFGQMALIQPFRLLLHQSQGKAAFWKLRVALKQLVSRHRILVEFCKRCGIGQPIVWEANRSLWSEVASCNVLCERCFDDLAQEKGIFLRWIPIREDKPGSVNVNELSSIAQGLMAMDSGDCRPLDEIEAELRTRDAKGLLE